METDGIEFAGDLLGAIEPGLGVAAGLETDEDRSALHTGNDTVVIGAGHQLLQCLKTGVFLSGLNRQTNGVLAGILIVMYGHDTGHQIRGR